MESWSVKSTVDDELVSFLKNHYLTSLVYTLELLEMALIGCGSSEENGVYVIKYQLDDKLIGCITGVFQKDTMDRDYLFVNFMCVHEKYRGKGIASLLKNKLLKTAIVKYPNAYAVYSIAGNGDTNHSNSDGNDGPSMSNFDKVCIENYYHRPINDVVFENVNSICTDIFNVVFIKLSTDTVDSVLEMLNGRSSGGWRGLYRKYTRDEFCKIFLHSNDSICKGFVACDSSGDVVGFVSYYTIYNKRLNMKVGYLSECIGDCDVVVSYLVSWLIRTRAVDLLNGVGCPEFVQLGFIKGPSELTWYTFRKRIENKVENENENRVGLVSI